MKILHGSSNKAVAQSLAQLLNIPLVATELTKFPNGESRVWIKENVAGENIILVQSFSQPVDTFIMETLLMIDALERMGARHINLIVPWFGYSLQDKVFRDGEPIAAKVVADLLSHSYVKRAFLMDLHNSSTTGFFAIPTHHVTSQSIFVAYARSTFAEAFASDQVLAASPDFGGLKRARVFANELGVNLVNIDKHRDLKTGEVTAIQVQGGDVRDKVVLIIDDVIVSGGTVLEAAKLLKKEGAREVHFFATHGLFVGNALENMTDIAIDSVIITNSVSHDSLPQKITVLDCAPLFAKELSTWYTQQIA